MGRKSKAIENGLVDLIIDKRAGGKNTIVYVTQEVNQWLEDNGLKVRFSRESIRRVIKSHEEQIEDTRKSIEAAKEMAMIMRDQPGTELAEASLMTMAGLINKELRSIDSLSFEDPVQICSSLARVSEAQLKLSNSRMAAVKALEKAKTLLKEELKKSIQNDAELLEKLTAIVDATEVT